MLWLTARRAQPVPLRGCARWQCHDRHCKRTVSVKVVRNDKDCTDAGLGEVRVLSLINLRDPQGGAPILRLLDYFYFKEHLIIVTELLRDSLFNLYRFFDTTPRRLEYFSMSTLASLSMQLLSALRFLHSIGVAHCDVKPENVCVVSVKAISPPPPSPLQQRLPCCLPRAPLPTCAWSE